MFKRRRNLFATLVLTLAVALASGWTAGPGPRAQDRALELQAPLGTGFTYQGQLTDNGAPATGPCDFRFALYDVASGGTQVGSTEMRTDVELSDGRFAVTLEFGPTAFDGTARWLQIGVQCAGDVDYTTLGRQALRAAPYALHASGAPWSGLQRVPPDLADGDDDTTYRAGTGLGLSGTQFSLGTPYRLPQACGNGQIAEWNGSTWTCGDDDVGAGGGGGDITTLYAGTGLSGGGTSGDVALSAGTSYLQRRVGDSCSSGNAIRVIGADGSVTCQSVNLDAYHVFLTPLGDCPLYVAAKTSASFTVQAMDGQTCNIAFDYRIVAKRLGYEHLRLDAVTLAADEEGNE